MGWGRHIRLLLLGLLLTVTTCVSDPSVEHLVHPEQVGPSIIPLSVHYLTDDTHIRYKFEQSLKQSNETLMPHGIGLVLWSEDRLYRLPEKVNTRHDRQRLGGRVYLDGTMHIFVVDSVSLELGDSLNGLHAQNGRHDFVILAKGARDTTLAHEVGHALGLDHVDDEDNVMCPGRDEDGTRFTLDQGVLMRVAARNYIVRDWQEIP